MIPHPLIHRVELRIQTSSSTVSPVEVLSSAIEDLNNETDHLISQTTDAIEQWRKENDQGGMGQF
jgi:DNA-directed RNA polymerase subunit L